MAAPRILGIRDHRGPSLYAPGRAVTMAIDWGAGAPPAGDRWRAVLDHPAVAAVGVALPAPAGGVDIASAVASVAVLLQRALGHEVADPRIAEPSPARIAVPVWDVTVGAVAARAALAIVAAGPDGPAIGGEVDGFLARVAAIDPEESTRRLLTLADRRRIPWSRLWPGSAIQRIGHGVRQVRIDGGALSSTGKIANEVSIRKDWAAALLRQHGIPVPANRLVRSLRSALAAAAELGAPLVVKPAGTNYGTAVTTGIRDPAALRRAYADAAAHGPVLVERQIEGDHTRLLVFQGRFVSAVRQDPAQVVGDGRRTVAALIAAVNATRTEDLSSSFRRIAVDREAHDRLAQQGLVLDDVPAAGRRVTLRYGSNTSRGGTAWNVTAAVHPDNARLAERATAVLGLDLAGVDLIMPDIARSHREVGGMICEINAGPGLYMREPGLALEETILSGILPGPAPGRVPIVCLIGDPTDRNRRTIGRIARTFGRGGGATAVVTPEVVAVGGWRYAHRPARLHDAVAAALADRETAAAAILVPEAAVEEDGLAFGACELAMIPDDRRETPVGRLLAGVADTCFDPADDASIARTVRRIVAERMAPMA